MHRLLLNFNHSCWISTELRDFIPVHFFLIDITIFVLVKERTYVASICEQDWTSYGSKANITILSSVDILCVTLKGSSTDWDLCP